MWSAALFSSFLTALLCLPLLASSTRSQQQSESVVDWSHLAALLDTIDDTILHGVLHQLSPKFQDGIFSKDRSAIEHVHSEAPAIATKLVHIAIKRQASNSTATTTSSQATTTPLNQASAISSALSSEIEASTVPAATTVVVPPTAPADATSITTEDGGVVYSTIGGGLVTLTSSAVSVKFTPSTSTHIFYSTLADGDVETSTSVVVVNAPVTQAAESSSESAAATSSSNPGLQNAAGRLEVSAAALALVGLAGLMSTL
ncbi:hypothetical protein DV737_g3435, partial [Chaetothyriales sp. CBS 132003]